MLRPSDVSSDLFVLVWARPRRHCLGSDGLEVPQAMDEQDKRSFSTPERSAVCSELRSSSWLSTAFHRDGRSMPPPSWTDALDLGAEHSVAARACYRGPLQRPGDLTLGAPSIDRSTPPRRCPYRYPSSFIEDMIRASPRISFGRPRSDIFSVATLLICLSSVAHIIVSASVSKAFIGVRIRPPPGTNSSTSCRVNARALAGSTRYSRPSAVMRRPTSPSRGLTT